MSPIPGNEGCQESVVAEAVQSYVLAHLPRVLTHLDRDPQAPTYGCFDRNFWHYKTQDFASAILQQSVLLLHTLSRSRVLAAPHREKLQQWAQASINFWAQLPTVQGGLNEYYPFESGYPPTAFSLEAIGVVLPYYQVSPPLLRQIQGTVTYLLTNFEEEALNQQGAGLAALALCRKIPGIRVDEKCFAHIAERFFSAQHAEGWFPEYGGPDIGYLSVTMDMLWDYYDATSDQRALHAIERALQYLAFFIAPDGSLGGICNSRNTDYIVPYGLARSGQSHPVAAAIVRRVFRCILEPTHFMASVDDRYHLHYTFNSCVRSLSYLSALSAQPAALPCDRREQRFFGGCGNLVEHRQGTCSVFIAGKKGGAVTVVLPDGVHTTDYGWRCSANGQWFVSNFWSNDYHITCNLNAQQCAIEGELVPITWYRPSPVKHLVVRVLSAVFNKRLMLLLKRRLIFRSAGGDIKLKRILVFDGDITIRDSIEGCTNGQIWRAERPSARHVSSAASFAWEELQHVPVEAVSVASCRDMVRSLRTKS
jgi:hypothetical protein